MTRFKATAAGTLPFTAEEEIAADIEESAWAADAANRLIESISIATQKRLDDFARTRYYDDIKSLSDYAGDADPIFDAEGTYGKSVRSQTWRTLFNIMDQVRAGARSMPTSYADIEAELPSLQWPIP